MRALKINYLHFPSTQDQQNSVEWRSPMSFFPETIPKFRNGVNQKGWKRPKDYVLIYWKI